MTWTSARIYGEDERERWDPTQERYDDEVRHHNCEGGISDGRPSPNEHVCGDEGAGDPMEASG